jgi:outer membrane protein insertion porin family
VSHILAKQRRTRLHFLNIFFLIVLSAVFVATPEIAHAAKTKRKKKKEKVEAPVSTTYKITKIEIQGNRKIEVDAINTHLKTKVGDTLTESAMNDQIRQDVVALFKTNYFYDIKVDRKIQGTDCTLTYIVDEKPSVTEITFEGASEIKTEELLETSGLKAFEILNVSKLHDAVDKIQKLYEDKGYFLAKIEYRIEDVKKDESVKVIFKIKENDKVKVRKITFLGNQKLKDNFLKSKLATTEGGYFSFVSGSGAYKQDAFDRDMTVLRYVYFNEGYVQVKIDRPEVYVTPDKKSIYITIRVEEGEQFDVGDIDFAGDLLFSRDELASGIKINKQQVFSYDVLQKDLGELQAKYGDLGYAFANVIPRTRINEKERKVDITFEFDKGNKVYFGQINVVGNSKTRDKVVRRELKIFEGELYNETRKRQSQENIQRLGFFEDVTFKTSTPPDKPDILNIDIVVKERNTGSIQLGAGYGSATGFSLQGQVQQANYLGKGQKLGAGVNLSQLYNTYFVNFTEPHYNDTDWSLGIDGYQSQANRYYYMEQIRGGALRVGHPLSDYLSLTLRYRYDQTQLSTLYATAADGTTQVLLTDPTLFPLNQFSGDTSSVTTVLEYDHRNDRLAPSDGIYASLSMEYAGIGGSLDYTKGVGTFRYFKKLFWDVVWRNNLSYSFITSNGNDPVPYNQRFLLGGPYTLRGYRFAKVGKSVYSPWYAQNAVPLLYPQYVGDAADTTAQSTLPVGGSQQALIQTEFEFPLIAEAGIKGVAFYDVGVADDVLSGGNVYSDVGFGFRWFSPIGPLRFEWGFPLVQAIQSPDPVEFQFSIGAPF